MYARCQATAVETGDSTTVVVRKQLRRQAISSATRRHAITELFSARSVLGPRLIEPVKSYSFEK
jgi:hypothetical protein